MSQAELIGTIVIAIPVLIGFIMVVTKPFQDTDMKIAKLKDDVQSTNQELIKSINELTSTMRLMNMTLEGFGLMFQKQDEFNDEIEEAIQTLKDDLKDFKYHCEKVQYYKDREPN